MNSPMRPYPAIPTPVGDFFMPVDYTSIFPNRVYDTPTPQPTYHPEYHTQNSAPISPYGPIRRCVAPRSPISCDFGNPEDSHDLAEEVRRTNLTVQLANGMISPGGRYAQLQPKMDRQGRFPVEFCTPRTVEYVRGMDSSVIERLLSFYELPSDLRSFPISRENDVPARVEKQAKLCTLFDYLGACRLADNERAKAEKWKRTLGVVAY